MDKFRTQSEELFIKEGHEETDISVRGIVLFLMSLAILGFAAFAIVLAFYKYLQHLDKQSQPQMTAVEQQLSKQREAYEETAGKVPLPPGQAETVKPLPDYYGRGKMDEHLARTFPGPRLQYDDVYDLTLFRTSQERWLASTGKNPDGTVHIPIDQAMDLLVKRGLPQVSGPFIPPMLPTAVPMVPANQGKR